MSGTEFGTFTLSLLLLISVAQVCGWLFARARQPRVAGEICAGILLGPAVLGRCWPGISTAIFHAGDVSVTGIKYQAVVGFLLNLGLVLLMFAAGSDTRGLFRPADGRKIGWLSGMGTGLPFLLTLAVAPWLPLRSMAGHGSPRTSLLLVIAISAAVTSIPVVAKIFHDLGISHTGFARLVLGVAVVEDIALWGVLAIATALAQSSEVSDVVIARHVLLAIVYFAAGLTLLPILIRALTCATWNVLARVSPVAYIVVVLLTYTAIAALLDVNLVFAAFLAGYALRTESLSRDAATALNTVSFAVFIPIYFAMVGYQLELRSSFPLLMLIAFLGLTSAVKLLSAGLGARIAGFSWRDTVNLSVTLNARGGPGIVVATVAYDAGIINPAFYTTLVLAAVLTSQAAGAWLEYVLRRGWPLLSGDETRPIVTGTDRRQPAM